ncbi:MAG: TolB family protein, partial [Longimicrobiales bacterium]
MTGGPNTDIHILVLDSAAARPLAQSSANEAGARWSPDGARLIFARTDSTGSNLLVINSTGSGLRHRARLPGTLSWTTWCPDGKHAVFTTKENGNEDLYA